jgi:predicted Zn-dependent protease
MPGGRIRSIEGPRRCSTDGVAAEGLDGVECFYPEHSREQASQQIAAQTGLGVGAAVLGVGGAGADLAAQGYQALVATKFSRTDENEADLIWLELAPRASYDPRACITLWKKMM